MSVEKSETQLMQEISKSLKSVESAVRSIMESCDRYCINEALGILSKAAFRLHHFKNCECSCDGPADEQEENSSPVESVRIPRPAWAEQVGDGEVRS